MSPPHPHPPAARGIGPVEQEGSGASPDAAEHPRLGRGRAERRGGVSAAPRAPWPQLPLSAVIESQAGLAGLLCDLVN